MLVLRKVLGYCTLSFFLAACVFGCIAKFAVNWGDLFSNLKDPQKIVDFAADWVFQLVFFVIIGIMAIVALATFHKLDDVKQEGQLQKLTLLYAICQLAAGIILISGYVYVTKGMSNMPIAYWYRVIFPVLVIIATIVRKAAFVGKNPMWSRIMGAFVMFLMFLMIILSGFAGFGALYTMVVVFFLIAYVLGIGFNVVSIFKK